MSERVVSGKQAMSTTTSVLLTYSLTLRDAQCSAELPSSSPLLIPLAAASALAPASTACTATCACAACTAGLLASLLTLLTALRNFAPGVKGSGEGWG